MSTKTIDTNNEPKSAIALATPNFWRAAGIALPTGDDAAMVARQALKDSGAHYIPAGTSADMALVVANVAQEAYSAAENSRKNAAVALAWLAETKEYSKAISANGKPYGSITAFARDVMPGLEKSTVDNLVASGRKLYLPAIMGKWSKAQNAAVLALKPSQAAQLKSCFGDKSTAEETKQAVEAIAKTMREKGTLSKKDASDIVKAVRTPSSDSAKGATDAGKTRKLSRKELRDSYDAKLRRIIPQSNIHIGDNGMTIVIPKEQVKVFETMLRIAETPNNPDVYPALIGSLREALFGKAST